MAFTKKRRTFKKKSFSKKRKYSKKRRSTKKRNYVSKKRKTGFLGRLNAPRMAMNVIPKTADRLHVKLDYKMRGQLLWANTAEQHIGMEIRPTYLGPWNASVGPFSMTWPAAGSNVNFPHTVSSTPGFYTLVSRFERYYVSSVKISVKVTRQEAADSTTCIIGMMPLNHTQALDMVHRNSTLSPTSNNSFMIPARTLDATVALTGSLCNSQLMTIKQQPYVKLSSVSMPYNGKMVGRLHQSYAMKKFSKMGFPFGEEFSGILPTEDGKDGTPPEESPAHYFFMQRTSAATCNSEAFDIEFDLQVSATFHQPNFMQSAPLYSDDSKEEKKTESKVDEADDEPEDLVDPVSSGLSLSSLSMSSPSQSPPGLVTCLNTAHPQTPHFKVSTCV